MAEIEIVKQEDEGPLVGIEYVGPVDRLYADESSEEWFALTVMAGGEKVQAILTDTVERAQAIFEVVTEYEDTMKLLDTLGVPRDLPPPAGAALETMVLTESGNVALSLHGRMKLLARKLAQVT